MTVGDTTYSTGDYLAYLYNTYSQVYQNYNFAMYAQYGMDPWEITILTGTMRKRWRRRITSSKPRRMP